MRLKLKRLLATVVVSAMVFSFSMSQFPALIHAAGNNVVPVAPLSGCDIPCCICHDPDNLDYFIQMYSVHAIWLHDSGNERDLRFEIHRDGNLIYYYVRTLTDSHFCGPNCSFVDLPIGSSGFTIGVRVCGWGSGIGTHGDRWEFLYVPCSGPCGLCTCDFCSPCNVACCPVCDPCTNPCCTNLDTCLGPCSVFCSCCDDCLICEVDECDCESGYCEDCCIQCAFSIFYVGNAQLNGTVSSVPTDRAGLGPSLHTLTPGTPSHSPALRDEVLTNVEFVGWSLTPTDVIFAPDVALPPTVTSVTITNASVTVYAVWVWGTCVECNLCLGDCEDCLDCEVDECDCGSGYCEECCEKCCDCGPLECCPICCDLGPDCPICNPPTINDPIQPDTRPQDNNRDNNQVAPRTGDLASATSLAAVLLTLSSVLSGLFLNKKRRERK